MSGFILDGIIKEIIEEVSNNPTIIIKDAKKCVVVSIDLIDKLRDAYFEDKSSTIEGVKCPKCGGEMLSRKGQYGVFWGCKNYPRCKGTRDGQGRSKQDREQEKLEKEHDKANERGKREWTVE